MSAFSLGSHFVVFLGRWNDANQCQQEMNCGVVESPADDVVHIQGSAGHHVVIVMSHAAL